MPLKHPGSLPLQSVDPFREVNSKKTTSTNFFQQDSSANKTNATSTNVANGNITSVNITTANVTTDIAELIDCFQDAFIAVNQDENEIHVGKLLLACVRLEATMRRIGFTQSAKDIAGNIRKIRDVYDKLPEECRDSMPAILQHEIKCGLNTKKIPEKSAACGLLWLGRSLNYQCGMFCHLLDNEGAEPYEAASVAYERDLRPYLPWALQKICQAAMHTLKAKRRNQIFAQIGGFDEACYGRGEEEATRNDLRNMMNFLKTMLCRWREVFSDLELGLI